MDYAVFSKVYGRVDLKHVGSAKPCVVGYDTLNVSFLTAVKTFKSNLAKAISRITVLRSLEGLCRFSVVGAWRL